MEILRKAACEVAEVDRHARDELVFVYESSEDVVRRVLVVVIDECGQDPLEVRPANDEQDETDSTSTANPLQTGRRSTSGTPHTLLEGLL